MATILLQAAGAAIGSVFGPVGAVIGRAAGALAGNLIDNSLLSSMTTLEGSHLSSARIAGAAQGAAITRVYGTARIGGTMIWATRFEEVASVERTGAKGMGPRVESFAYFANFALGLCEGQIAGIRRVWADGQELPLAGIEMRLHRGTLYQDPDPLIEAKQGTSEVPAYRGLAYVVFEGLPLEAFGNRIPVLEFEVMRVVGPLESRIKAVTVIPGATEHGYDPTGVSERIDEGEKRVMNRNQLRAPTDFKASLGELLDLCPNLERVALVVSWFGTSLAASECQILPGVEIGYRNEESRPWSVGGLGRAGAHLVSAVDGRPCFGGTPSDASVIDAIAWLKDHGIKVFLYPFLLMDIPADNTLANPYGAGNQPAFPWRGRITLDIAPGRPGSPDRTAQAASQVASFTGNAGIGDFTVIGQSVTYTGNSTGYRRMILHYAHLAEAAGGVDGLIIGSELRGLTSIRNQNDGFPFVADLVQLAGDVRSITGAKTKLTYGADWSEYFGYHPEDGSGDVFFHLDPLWACNDIDAVGIDNYMPLADWRDADHVAPNPDGARCADDEAALRAAITSGEGFDYYYASDADRTARLRTPITDGLAGENWTFRFKDIEGWWSNVHRNRTGGQVSAAPTGWQPGMKPVWFTEIGCPAISRGPNQPNVFVDPGSSESAFPHFSSGHRSDCAQRRFLDASLSWWAGNKAPAGMVDPDHVFVWTWDSRPWPAFPEETDIFADGRNWRTGHWLNGRLGAGTLPAILSRILADHGYDNHDVSAVSGDLPGYVIASLGSARQAIEPLLAAFRLDARIADGVLTFASRGQVSAPATSIEILADLPGEPFFSEKRGHDSDFASQAIIDYAAQTDDYEETSNRSRRITPANDRVMRISLPGVLAEGEARRLAETLLRDVRLSVRSVSLALPMRDIALEPGDVISLPGRLDGRFRIARIEDGLFRRIEAQQTGEGDIGNEVSAERRKRRRKNPSRAFAPAIELMDLAAYTSGAPQDFARVAVTGRPWTRSVLSVSPVSEGYESRAAITRPATIGALTAPLGPGRPELIDETASIEARLFHGELQSVSTLALFAGSNRLAIRAANGQWEIIGFRDAAEIAAGEWRLSGLLRGLAGTTDAMAAGAEAGAPLVLLDSACQPIGLAPSEAGRSLNVRIETIGLSPETLGAFTFTGGLRAATPLAPVHLRAHRLASGAIAITFIRSGRIEADDWEQVEIALDEPEEGYLLEILDGTTIRRSVDLAAPDWLYGTDAQIADFGALPATLSFRVRQKGRKVALGIAAEASVGF
jgi:hypothetical protein